MIAETPIISVDASGSYYRLFATSYGQTAPAGPRLFRAPPHPAIDFGLYSTLESANKDAVKLTEYLVRQSEKKGLSKAKLRRLGDKAEVEGIKDAVWMA